MEEKQVIEQYWIRRCREVLYALVSGTIRLSETPPLWLQKFTLPKEAVPDAALMLTARDARLEIPVSNIGLNALMLLVSKESGTESHASLVHAGTATQLECAVADGEYLIAFYTIPDATTLFTDAEALRELKRWDDALREFERSLQLDGQQYRAWRGKAFVLRELQRQDEALQSATRAVEICHDYALGWRTKGALLRDFGRHQEGLECYERGIELDPDDEMLWRNKVNALRALNRSSDVEETLRQFAERFPGKSI